MVENVPDSFYNTSKLLGGYLRREPLLGETACMGAEERVVKALFLTVLKLWPTLSRKDLSAMSFEELVRDIAIPLEDALGYANWPRDVITDMAIFRGEQELRERCNLREEVERDK